MTWQECAVHSRKVDQLTAQNLPALTENMKSALIDKSASVCQDKLKSLVTRGCSGCSLSIMPPAEHEAFQGRVCGLQRPAEVPAPRTYAIESKEEQ